MNSKRIIHYSIAALLALSLQGCIVSTIVGTAVDVGVEVVKIPFKVGGAIVDGVSGGDKEEKKDEKQK